MSTIRKSKIIWLTGMSGAGKSFYAKYLYKILLSKENKIKLLDGDTIRDNYDIPLGFSKNDIYKNNMYISKICKNEYQKYDFTIVSVISPYESVRKDIKKIFNNDICFIYVYADIKSLKKRDTKKLYSKADNKEITDLIGYSKLSKYEIPVNPDLILDTSEEYKPKRNYILLDNYFGLNKK